ncbi:MAG TPA: maltose alpha-D-glucosyltransferase, partial [Azonexus sp.]|nr:maltose alpha-D-glucosyltransferase [Azonexus sp.]
WYKDAVIYELHVKAFFDSNNDGIGDFAGLIQKLDYLQDLGVTAIWLLPFYPSPQKDDGYDIADYHGVNPDYGSRADFRQFVRQAHRRGLRVITELVVNHTSDTHPWFQAARRAPPGSSKRDYYVWSDSNSRYAGTRIIFSDTETSNWTYDPVAQAYYWHRFFSHQPDLNFDNPSVRKALVRVMRFWLDQGVDGFRLDAIPYLCEREGTNNENLPETHVVIKEIRAVIDAHYRGRLLLAEANQWPEDVRDYFGDGDECHMAYHFPLMPRMYMAIAQEDRHPVVEIMQQTPDIPENCQWAIFLRNHDELTLEMVTSKERDYMYQMYAADRRARINLGIRRRLAPLMENDPERIKLMNALLMSMPGSPIIYYGDELGMGDNVYLGDRDGVRTPMQWSPDRNAGFSKADPQRLYLPPIMDPIYGYEAVNVEAQARDPSSLLNWTRRLLAVRKGFSAFGRGSLRFLHPGNRKILAFLREYEDQILLCVANLARTAQPVELDLAAYKGRVPVELLGRTPFPPIGELPYLVTLPGHAFYWFRLAAGEAAPSWHAERLPPEEAPVLVFFDGWHSIFRERVVPWRIGLAEKLRAQLERETLPRFVTLQRWYGAHGEAVRQVALVDHAEWNDARGNWFLAVFRVEAGATAGAADYFLPLTLVWEDDEERSRAMLPATVARVRMQAQVGVLGDAFADEAFARALVEAIGAGREFACAHGTIRCTPSSAFAALAGDDPAALLPVRPPAVQSSNSIRILGQRLFLKLYRRLQAGVCQELEIGRFLTDVAHFSNCVPVAGAIEYHPASGADGGTMTLALLQSYVENQGDGWSYTLAYLERFFEHFVAAGNGAPPAAADVHGAYLALVRTLGRRTAELHQALALSTGDPLFDPEPVAEHDLATWGHTIGAEAVASLDLLEGALASLPAAAQPTAEALLVRRQELLSKIEASVPASFAGLKTRHHGDYHLGQVLVAQNDFIIIDFEGEPTRSLEQRRQKNSPLRDVAGMLRSFDYAVRSTLARAAGESPKEAEALTAQAAAWRTVVDAAFIDSYAATAAAGSARLYGEWSAARRLLALFVFEKALYELRYELAHRPDWVALPLQGILAALGD